MGSGIAAHLASAGIQTLLLDILPPDLAAGAPRADRNRFAGTGLAKAQSSKPALFLVPGASRLVEVGNFEDDLAGISECDWVIEVVVENLAVKKSLFERVERHWRPGCIVSSNTSGLSLPGMTEGRSAAFQEHFLGTHFFNPVRYMHLLEVIRGPRTKDEVVTRVVDFSRKILGKGIVFAKDTTNFIANRIGVFGMMDAMRAMIEMGYTPEEVDAIVGRPMGRPKSAAFRTADVVGLDTLVHVAQNCYDSLTQDPQREVFAVPDFLRQMIQKGLTGRKSGAGFYRKQGEIIQTIDLKTLEYRDPIEPNLPELKALKSIDDPGKRLAALCQSEGRAGTLARHLVYRSLAYSARIAFEIADDIVNIDRAMRWGFSWDQGPFEAWQSLGVRDTVDRLRAADLEVPAWVDQAAEAGGFYQAAERQTTFFQVGKGRLEVPGIPGALCLAPLKASGGVVEKNRGATLLDLGDGIACLEFHTKMNTVDPDLIGMLDKSCELVERGFDGLVLANEAENFSAGANLMLIAMHANQKKYDAIAQTVRSFQAANQRLKYLARPVVSNPQGLSLGGGCEMAMAADRMVVAKECYMGLVEVGVGLIPGGGGTLNLLKRVLSGIPASAQVDRLPFVQRAFEAIALAKVATGAGEVFELGFATSADEIAINQDTRIADAKRLCRYLADRGYTPPRPADNLVLPGPNGVAAIQLYVYGLVLGGHATEYDAKIATKLAHVLCGGATDGRRAVDEQTLLDLELEVFLSLVAEPNTLARMQHMLMHQKPLRN
jgi:3-hydroxyacyl-CoA dehydrogenase